MTDDKNIIFNLTNSISAHGETIEILELTEPTGKDIRECGFPQKISPDGAIDFNASVVMKYIERLCKIPSRSVDQICATDLLNLTLIITGFFLKSPQT